MLGQVMNLADALIILDNSDPKRPQNIIVVIFYMVLEGAPMIPSHALS